MAITHDIFGDGSAVASYPLDSDASDSGLTYDGTPSFLTYEVGGIDSRAIFNGGSSSIDLTAHESAFQSPTYSVSFHIKPDTFAGELRTIFSSFYFQASGIYWGKLIRFDATGKIQVAHLQGSGFGVEDNVLSTTALTVGVESHVCITSNNNLITIYINGVASGSKQLQSLAFHATVRTLHIGKMLTSGQIDYGDYDGTLDTFRYFNKAVSPAEVLLLRDETPSVAIDNIGKPDSTLMTTAVEQPVFPSIIPDIVHDVFGDGSCLLTYPLDTDATDSGGLHNGTLSGLPLPTFDERGFMQSYEGDGAIDSGWNPKLQTFTISFWWEYNTTNNAYFFAEDNTGSGNSSDSGYYAYYLSATNEFQFATKNGTLNNFGKVAFTVTGKTVGDMIHIVCETDGTANNNKVFFDTVEMGSVARPDLISYVAFTGRESNLLVGTYYYLLLSKPQFMDTFRYFDKILSTAEILVLFEETTTITPPDIIQPPSIFLAITALPIVAPSGQGILDLFIDGTTVCAYEFDNDITDLGDTYNGTNAVELPTFDGVDKQVGTFSGDFTPTNAHVDLKAHQEAFKLETYTVSFWHKAPATTNIYTIFSSFYRPNAGESYGIYIQNNFNTLNVYHANGTGGSTPISVTATFTADVWTHIVVTFDGVDLQIYADDLLVSDTPHIAVPFHATLGDASIGKWSVDTLAYQYYLLGKLDELRFMNRSVSASEVSTLYNYDSIYVIVPHTELPDVIDINVEALWPNDEYNATEAIPLTISMIPTYALGQQDIVIPLSITLFGGTALSVTTVVQEDSPVTDNFVYPIEIFSNVQSPDYPIDLRIDILKKYVEFQVSDEAFYNELPIDIFVQQPNISSMPFNDGVCIGIPITIFQPKVNDLPKPDTASVMLFVNSPIIRGYPEFMQMEIHVYDAPFSGGALVFDDIFTATPASIMVNITQLDSVDVVGCSTLLIDVNSPAWIGENIIPPPADPQTIIYAQVVSLRFSMLYIKSDVHAFVTPQTLVMAITEQEPILWDIAYPDIPTMSIKPTSSVAQPYRGKKVTQVGSVILDAKLFWSENTYVNKFLGASLKTIDGGSTQFILAKKQYTNEYSISSRGSVYLETSTVIALRAEVNNDIYDIIFDDGSVLEVKNNLLQKPFVIEPIYEGSDKYYLTMEVLG